LLQVLGSDGATVHDEVRVLIGVRSAVFDPRHGFLLNGVKVMIKGACRIRNPNNPSPLACHYPAPNNNPNTFPTLILN
jgi:beta-galactosidase/beta-glucuronidase